MLPFEGTGQAKRQMGAQPSGFGSAAVFLFMLGFPVLRNADRINQIRCKKRKGDMNSNSSTGIIFDIDGTLVDSYSSHLKAWQINAEHYGFDFPDELFTEIFGSLNRDYLPRILGGRSTPELVAEIDHAIESTYRDVIAKEFPAMPGAVELVRSLHDAGFKIAVGSSAPRENVDVSIRGLGIEPLLSAVVCQNDVKEVKPNPAIFLQAAKQMGILPENCIVIEDSTFGIAAAKAAGMYCIGFQSKGHYPEEYGQADRVIHSLTELGSASILAISRSRNIVVQKYFVCLIDVLGQQDRLRSWAKMPENGQVTPQYLEAVKKSAGTVVQLNIGFQNFFKKFIQKNFIRGKISSDEHKKENLDLYSEFIKFREREYSQTVSTQQFSDTLIFYAPLVMRGTKQFSLLPPIAMICACAWTMLDALQTGIPFRGGLALDAGLYDPDCGFYGPALLEAYRLESQEAEYPRIVVSGDLFKLTESILRKDDMPTPDTPEDYIERSVLQIESNDIYKYLFQDLDGKTCIDYMGQEMRDSLAGMLPQETITRLIKKAYMFACDEEEKFKSQGNQKLCERYARLRAYMDTRLALWGLGHLLHGHW